MINLVYNAITEAGVASHAMGILRQGLGIQSLPSHERALEFPAKPRRFKSHPASSTFLFNLDVMNFAHRTWESDP